MPDFGRWTSNGGDPSLNEINRADRFIDALSTTAPVYSTDAAEAELAALLSDWRDDVRDAPVTAPVTPHDAVIALHGGLSTGRRSRRGFAVVGSVAAAMLCVGGFGAAVYGAGPGDSLYGMRSSLFGTQEATRDDQVSLASAQLQQVQQLIDRGQWQQAQDKLVQVSSAVQNVDQVESKQQLVNQWNALTYKVVEQNPAATLPPGEPLPVLPSSPLTWLPVPVVQATTTSQSTVTSESTTTSGAVVTSGTSDPSNTSVPSEVLLTPVPGTSTSSSATPPSTSTTTTASPSTTTSTTATSTTTTTTTTATTTPTRPVQPAPSPVAAESPAPPASPPRPVPSSPKPEALAPAPSSQPVAPSTPVVSSEPKAPSTTTPIPPDSAGGRDSGAAVTTTIVPPR